MATGPEHYQMAEQLLDKQAEEAAQRGDTEIEALSVAHAQVHATLALAAAAEPAGDSDTPLGRAAYEAYSYASDGKSLVSGDRLPGWDALPPDIQFAWDAAAAGVLMALDGKVGP